MKFPRLAYLVATLAAFSGSALAQIPGLFVVQEARIDDQFADAVTKRSLFGRAGFASIGDFDGDGVEDILVGAPRANSDSGALAIELLNQGGKLKSAPFLLHARLDKIRSNLGAGGTEQFGYGVAVVRKFSKTQPCAIALANSGSRKKIWALKICNEQGLPSLRDVKVFDTTSSALSGFSMTDVGIGSSMEVIDTLANDGRVIALGVPSDGRSLFSYFGRIVIVSIDSGTMTLNRVSMLPEKYDGADVVGKILDSLERFGTAIALTHGINGSRGIAVVSPTYVDGSGNASGRICLVSLDNNYKAISSSIIVGSPDFALNQAPTSIASADFNRDGISDLAVGYGNDMGGATTVTRRGAVRIMIMNRDGSVRNSDFLRKGSLGLQDTANGSSTMLAYTRFGSQLRTVDFDQDGQIDLLVGSLGNPAGSTPDIVGSVWPLRLKQLPRMLKSIDTITLSKTEASLRLHDYMIGNHLSWTLTDLQTPPTSLVKCSLEVVSDVPYLHCIPGATNGVSSWRLVATDSGNIPSTLHFSDSLNFVVKIVGQDSAPVKMAELPLIRISEDQRDTAVLVFSKYFRDPEQKHLTVSIAPVNSSNAASFSYLALSANTDTLHLAGKPYRPAYCSLFVEVKDNANGITRAMLVIDVFHVNHAPIAFDTAYTVTESVPSSFVVRVLDHDLGDVLTSSIQTTAKHGTAVMQGQTVFYTPDSFYVGIDSIQYKVSDGQASATSMIRVAVIKTTATAKVYKPLTDVTIDEDTPPLVIRVDSLFFSGADRFAVLQDEAITDCESQKIALVKNDRINFRLNISPLPNQSGRCQIKIPVLSDSQVNSIMFLNIKAVADPYKYSPDTVTAEVSVGNTYGIQLDSVDLDRDTLLHTAITTLPEWVKLEGYRLSFQPLALSKAAKILIEVRKKVLPGVTNLDPTDTLILYAIPTPSTHVGRRLGDGVRMINHSSKLMFRAGGAPFQITLVALDGRVLLAQDVPELGQVEIDRSRLPSVVYLRLIEKNKTTLTPLFLHSSN